MHRQASCQAAAPRPSRCLIETLPRTGRSGDVHVAGEKTMEPAASHTRCLTSRRPGCGEVSPDCTVQRASRAVLALSVTAHSARHPHKATGGMLGLTLPSCIWTVVRWLSAPHPVPDAAVLPRCCGLCPALVCLSCLCRCASTPRFFLPFVSPPPVASSLARSLSLSRLAPPSPLPCFPSLPLRPFLLQAGVRRTSAVSPSVSCSPMTLVLAWAGT